MIDVVSVAISPVNYATSILIPPVILGAQANVDGTGVKQCCLELSRALLFYVPHISQLHSILAVGRTTARLDLLVRIVFVPLESRVL